MTGQITEDDKSEQPFRVKLKNGKLSWFKEAWLEEMGFPLAFAIACFSIAMNIASNISNHLQL